MAGVVKLSDPLVENLTEGPNEEHMDVGENISWEAFQQMMCL